MLKNLFKKYRNLVLLLAVALVFLTVAQTTYALELTYPTLFGYTVNHHSKLPDYIVYFFVLAVIAAGLMGVVSIAWGGIRYISSAGNPESVGYAKDRIRGSILGIILLMFSYILLNTINPSLVNPKTKGIPIQFNGMVLINHNVEPAAGSFNKIFNPFGLSVASAHEDCPLVEVNGIPHCYAGAADETDDNIRAEIGPDTLLWYYCPGETGPAVLVDLYIFPFRIPIGATTVRLACKGDHNPHDIGPDGQAVSLDGYWSYDWRYEEPG